MKSPLEPLEVVSKNEEAFRDGDGAEEGDRFDHVIDGDCIGAAQGGSGYDPELQFRKNRSPWFLFLAAESVEGMGADAEAEEIDDRDGGYSVPVPGTGEDSADHRKSEDHARVGQEKEADEGPEPGRAEIRYEPLGMSAGGIRFQRALLYPFSNPCERDCQDGRRRRRFFGLLLIFRL